MILTDFVQGDPVFYDPVLYDQTLKANGKLLLVMILPSGGRLLYNLKD